MNLSNQAATKLGWLGLLIVVLSFVGYFGGVWLIQFLSVRLRSIRFIKVIHTIVFVVISGMLVGMVYEVILNRITFITWITVAVFLAEGIVLIMYGWRCPLTAIAENLGSEHGQITDTLLPKWFADRIFTIYTWLFGGALLVLAARLVTS